MKCLLSIFLATLAGCAAVGGEKTIVKVDRDQPPVVKQAPAAGSYGLFSATDRSPILTVVLRGGERLGFRRTGNGLVAVAGDTEVPLAGGKDYDWRRIPRDVHEGDRGKD